MGIAVEFGRLEILLDNHENVQLFCKIGSYLAMVVVVVVQSFVYLVEGNQLMVVIVLHQIDYLDL